jgi:hypothetical protein
MGHAGRTRQIARRNPFSSNHLADLEQERPEMRAGEETTVRVTTQSIQVIQEAERATPAGSSHHVMLAMAV